MLGFVICIFKLKFSVQVSGLKYIKTDQSSYSLINFSYEFFHLIKWTYLLKIYNSHTHDHDSQETSIYIGYSMIFC